MKKIIIFLILFGFLAPIFSYQASSDGNEGEEEIYLFALAQDLPENTDQLKQTGEQALETAQKELPGIFKKIFLEDVWPIWQKMFNWFKIHIWPKIWPPAKQEAEKRKEIFKEEFPAEKQQVKEEAPGLIKSLWNRFKEIIR